ncbi:MAG: TM2 domain-containing protein [Bacilli bacterium]
MAHIIKIENDDVFIGTDDNKIKTVRKNELDFDAKIGVEVDIFEDDYRTIITKHKKENVDAVKNVDGPYKVNKIIYLLLCFFLGGFGAHKLYARKSTCVLYLMFCWTFIPSLVAFFDFFIALFTGSDEFGKILI